MNNASFARNVLLWLRAWLFRVLVAATRSNAARVFCAVWILIIAIAPLREIASTVQQNDNIYSNGFKNDEFNVYDEYSESRVKKALAKIVALPKERALAHTENGRDVQERISSFDKLLHKYPADGVITARYIINALAQDQNQYQTQRIPQFPQQPSSGAPLIDALPNGAPPTGTLITQNQIQKKHEALRKIIVVARRGQKIEPNNVFFDAVLIVCYVQLNRDSDAYRVLDASRHKTMYDAHSLDVLRATAAELKRMHPHLLEYQISLFNWGNWRSDIHFHNAAEVLAQENWRDDQKNRGMQNRDARLRSLQRRADIAQMLAKILLGRSAQIQQDYRGTPHKVWRNDWSKEWFGRVRFAYANKVLSERFAREATALQQSQIAAQTRKIAAQNAQIRGAFVKMSIGDYDPFSFQKLRWLSRLQGSVLIQIGLAVALYVFASLLLLFAEKTVPQHNRTALKSAVIGSISGALCLAFAYSLVLSGTYDILNPNISVKTIMIFMACLLAFFAVPLMTIVLCHAFAKSESNGETRAVKNLETRLIEYSMLPPLRKLLDFAWFSVLSQLWIFAALQFVNEIRDVRSYDLPFLGTLQTDFQLGFVALALGFSVIIIYFLMLWRWPSFSTQRASSHIKLRSFRTACGLSITLGSVLFLITLLASLPTRHAIAQKFDTYLKHDGLWLATGQDSAQWIAKLRQ